LNIFIIFEEKNEMNLFTFSAEFTSEDSCREHFKQERDKLGVTCARCQNTTHYWIKSKWSYECKTCNHRTSLRSGTIMQSSNLSFMIWYKTMFLLSVTKKGFSSKEIQKQLGLKRYEPVWAMVHKLRKAMGKRDARYTLEGMIEMDEAYFTIEASELERSQGVRGKGAKGKSNVAILAESTPLEDIDTGSTSSHCRYFKAKVLENHTAAAIDDTLKDAIDKDSVVITDKSTSYVNIADYVEMHLVEKSSKEVTRTSLRWVHIAISNAKRNLLGNYHKVQLKYLQLYLNEFVYKLNRRYFGERLFERLVIANITGL
jgi:ISXO2-like transposase domain